MKKFKETHVRTVIKVISWRVLITLSHLVNAFLITGSLETGLKIAGIALIVNSLLFWTHERLWNRLQWNRNHDEKLSFNEGQPRSISKVVSWRFFITASNFVIPFLATGNWGQAALFTGMATVTNMILYWSHERIWNWIKFGKTTISPE